MSNDAMTAFESFGDGEEDEVGGGSAATATDNKPFEPNDFFNIGAKKPETPSVAPASQARPTTDASEPKKSETVNFGSIGARKPLESQPGVAISADIHANDGVSPGLSQPSNAEQSESLLGQLRTVAKEISTSEALSQMNGTTKQSTRVELNDVTELTFIEKDELDTNELNQRKESYHQQTAPVQQTESLVANRATTPHWDVNESEEDAAAYSNITQTQVPSTEDRKMFPFDLEVIEAKPVMVDLNRFVDDTKITGDILIKHAELLSYQGSKWRASFTFVLAYGAIVKGTQFNIDTSVVTKDSIKLLEGKVAKVTGAWNLFQNQKQIRVDALTQTLDTVPEDFVPMEQDLRAYDGVYEIMYNSISKPGVKALWRILMEDNGYRAAMKKAAASKSMHDSGEAGLYKHSIRVAYGCWQAAAMFPHCDRDIATTGGLLQDIEKITELVGGEYTVVGNLIGHIVLGYDKVKDACIMAKREEPSFTNEQILNILHCILSHHGKLEYASPVIPKTAEATLVHYMDELDSRMQNMKELISGGQERGYSKMIGSEIYDLGKVKV